MSTNEQGKVMQVQDSSLDSLQLRSRAYQIEMWEISLERNVIVAMDTGSGKTQVALLRIATELEQLPPEKLIWFLAPNVALCRQQYEVICRQLPAATAKLLLGSDGVSRWSNTAIWNSVLSGVHIVVSTHAVLSDALAQGFVNIWQLALLIFDEAHHCVANHAGNLIMKDFYYPQLKTADQRGVPRILGLSASPAMSATQKALRTIESNLNSITITPYLQRSELSRYVYCPKLKTVEYDGSEPECRMLEALADIVETNASKPAFLSLRMDDQAIKPKKKSQLKNFLRKARHVNKELGPWAAEHYIIKSIESFKDAMRSNGENIVGWNGMEKDSIMQTLSLTNVEQYQDSRTTNGLPKTSKKFDCLLEILLKQKDAEFCGLVFVEQRATVVALCHLLSEHPSSKSLFRCSTFVGMSTDVAKKTEIGDLLDSKNQQATLFNFRERNINLIITTNALEEGIDVRVCNTVVCFNEPPNVKSFIQRRGRARAQRSSFFVLSEVEKGRDIGKWRKAEQEIFEMYQKDRKTLEEACRKEQVSEDSEESTLTIEDTGAVLTFARAIPYLHHFCATLPKPPYCDNRPLFTCKEDEVTDLIHAEVCLPRFLPFPLRVASASRGWRTERVAKQDAAFQCYNKLYKAGLVNNHLLPAVSDGLEFPEDFPSLLRVAEQFNPWGKVATAWKKTKMLYHTTIRVHHQESHPVDIMFVLPLDIEPLFPFTLPATGDFRPSIMVDCSQTIFSRSETDLDPILTMTRNVLDKVYRSRVTDAKDFLTMFGPAKDVLDACDYAKTTPEGAASKYRDIIVTRNLSGSLVARDPADASLWLPLLLYRIEVSLVAAELLSMMVTEVKFTDPDMVIASICPPSEQVFSTKKQLSFIGSTIIKYLVVRQLFANHTIWHEGDLSRQKDLIISNFRLARAAVDSGLDKFIITKAPGAKLYFPIYCSETKADESEAERTMGVNELAGVVQAMIGAARLEGDFDNAISCARFFLSEIKVWSSTSFFDGTFAATRPAYGSECPGIYTEVERLIGHVFADKSLMMEAVTHPSCEISATVCSYQRLAILGDAIVEMLVVDYPSRDFKTHSRGDLHLLKVAVTHAQFLGFLCMEASVTPEIYSLPETASGSGTVVKVAHAKQRHIWQFMRANNRDIVAARSRTLERYSQLRESLCAALSSSSHGSKYPWAELALLDADEFFSDLIKALFGAIFADSKGELARCHAMAERLGIFRYLRHFLSGGTDLRHPKSMLSELVVPGPGQEVVYSHGDGNGNGDAGTESGSESQSWCAVSVGGRELGRVSDDEDQQQCSRECKEIRVAEIALAKLLRESSNATKTST